MVSQLKVNEIIKQSGSSITIGEAGDTLTIPTGVTMSGSVANTPAFRAYKPSPDQSISNQTQTVIQLSTEEFDIGGCFNNTGSTVTLNGISTPAYAFAPNVAGKYLITGSVRVQDDVDYDENALIIMKNGSTEEHNFMFRQMYFSMGLVSTIVEFNGTSDYITLIFYHNRGGSLGITGNRKRTFMTGHRLIGA